MSIDRIPVSRATDEVDRSLSALRHWARDLALPLWSARGFDAAAAMFEEQLAFDGSPVPGVPRRLMVQARQISVYALASHHRWFDGRHLALAATQTMLDVYWARDGLEGWTFAVDRAGEIADPRRDLYAHAFVLFALAWMVRLSPDDRFVAAIEATIRVLDTRFKDRKAEGFWDCLPRGDAMRRQNPHMHLLEAFLELYDATGDPAYLTRATKLVDLAVSTFVDPVRGTIRETFDAAWRVAPAWGLGSVEPGHQFEWAWLLRRFDRATGASSDALVRALVASALEHGTDRTRGRIVDETGEDGAVRRAASRAWPHAEAVKCLASEIGRGFVEDRTDLARILVRLKDVYCPDALAGGWIDHVSECDVPISRVMPASTMYHLMFALAECETRLG